MKALPRVAPSLLALVLFPAGVLAQAYGTGEQVTVLAGSAFRGRSSTDAFTSNGGPLTPSVDNTTTFVAPVHLPNGAVLDQVQVLVTDNDPFNDITASLLSFGHGPGTSCGPNTIWSGSAPGLNGAGILSLTGSPLTIETNTFCVQDEGFIQYVLQVPLPSSLTSLAGAVLVWHRQVSGAPDEATFGDVPLGDPFFRSIEALARSGITSGCGGGNFCPNQVVTRNQLAKFLANALGLHFPQNGGSVH